MKKSNILFGSILILGILTFIIPIIFSQYLDINEISGIARFRVNCFKQMGHIAAVMRIIPLKIKTIDDNDRKLEKGMLLIADEKNPVAIAGVMGGKDTEINTDTSCY